jgi:hypothetical protein
MMATVIPAAVSRAAIDGPACPVPITMASKRLVMTRHRRQRIQTTMLLHSLA